MPTRDAGPFARATGVNVYMSSGRRDRMIPADVAETLAAQLRDAGATVTLAWDEGGHELSPTAIHGAREWLTPRPTS
jgi:phospholipase/carboxylesterase